MPVHPIGRLDRYGRRIPVRRKEYRPRNRNEDALVYFIQGKDEGPIKIGASLDPGKRMQEMQTGYPYSLRLLATHEGGYGLERSLHWYLWHYKVRGEWFTPCPLITRIMYLPGYLAQIHEIHPKTRLWEKGAKTPLPMDRCEVCEVSLFGAYGKGKLCLETQCAACIEAAPYREMEDVA